jgi:hypothetical protein
VTISTLTRLVTLLLEVQKYSSGERHNGGEAGAADGIVDPASSTRHRRLRGINRLEATPAYRTKREARVVRLCRGLQAAGC